MRSQGALSVGHLSPQPEQLVGQMSSRRLSLHHRPAYLLFRCPGLLSGQDKTARWWSGADYDGWGSTSLCRRGLSWSFVAWTLSPLRWWLFSLTKRFFFKKFFQVNDTKYFNFLVLDAVKYLVYLVGLTITSFFGTSLDRSLCRSRSTYTSLKNHFVSLFLFHQQKIVIDSNWN